MANGKRYAAASKTVDREKTYDLAEAVKLAANQQHHNQRMRKMGKR